MLVRVEDAVATVVLNRPERGNATNAVMLRELARALRECDAADDVRAIVLTGAGRSFCVGADLGSDGNAGFGVDPRELDDIEWTAPYHLRTPVIAALNGDAVGAGLTLALQCDLRIVATDARLGLPFVRVGVIAEWMGHWTAVHSLGLPRAAQLLLTGELINGETAAAWGLANQAVPRADVAATAAQLASRISTRCAPLAVAASKRLLWTVATLPAEPAGRLEHALLDQLLATDDASEGPTAFLAKRPPHYAGRLSTDLPAWPDVPQE